MIDLPFSHAKPAVVTNLDEAHRILNRLKRDPRLSVRQRVELVKADAQLAELWRYWTNNEHGPYSGTLEAYEAQQELAQDALNLTQRLARLKNEIEGRV